jgi:hypothetical protein
MRLLIVGGILALAVSASLTVANGADEATRDAYGIFPSGRHSCFGALPCTCRVQCGDIPVGKPLPHA